MIKKLRIKLVLVITGALVLIFGATLATLNISVYRDNVNQTRRFLSMIAENDGFFLRGRNEQNPPDAPRQPGFNPDDLRARRFFFVKINAAGEIFKSDYGMMFDFSIADAKEYIASALSSRKTSGNAGYFSYLTAEKPYGKIVVFAERRVEMGILSRFMETSLTGAGISCVVLFALSAALSKWITAPVKIAFEKQRAFVSDANHELKTPLTIISANLDILESETPPSERFERIRTQLTRMNKLIHDLLTLSKTEYKGAARARFDLSRAILSATLEFESRAYEDEKKYEYDIQENIFYFGDEENLRRLLSILADNALNHSDKGALIKISLKDENGKPRLSVYNDGTGIPDSERERVFDRFYRLDNSRARETGGYGLGLAIAKTIAEAHKGKLTVSGKYGQWVRFDAKL